MIDEHAVTDLELYIKNESDLYGQMTSIFKNLATKKARGVYQHDLAVKLFMYLVEAGAKKYAKAFDTRVWHQVFDVPTRRAVAESLTEAFEAEAKLGNYDYLLPKKYQEAAAKIAAWNSPATKASMDAKTRKNVAARKKSPARLQREINETLASRAGKR